MLETFVKTADNNARTKERAELYQTAASTPEGKAALGKATPQEWLLRGAGGVGGGLLGWLIGRTLSKKHKSLRWILGALGAAAGSGGADYLMKHVPGVSGSDLSYSDITRLRSGIPGLVEKAVDLESRGAGQPNTPSQVAMKNWANNPTMAGRWTTWGGIGGAGAGLGYGVWTGNIIGQGNITAKTLAERSRQAASSAAGSGDSYRMLSDWLAGRRANGFERAAEAQGLSRSRLRKLRASGRLKAVKDPATGLSHLDITNTKRRRALAGVADAALLGIASAGAGAGMDALLPNTLAPGALKAGLSAKF